MDNEFRQMVIDALKQGEDLPREWARELFPPEKREYELVYSGKEREEDILANTMAVPLQPASTFGKNGDASAWHNMLIFGDNLQVLKTLLKMKERGELTNADGTPGVRLVYIDPPFATKREFSGGRNERAFTDRLAGAQFIEFLRKRLVLLHELMADDGSIYVHLDWKRQAYIRIILDEIFGENNFRNEIYWYYYNKMPDARKGIFPRATDTLQFYVKNPNRDYPFNPLVEKRDVPVQQLVRKKVAGRMINVKDEDGNLVYQSRDIRTIDNVWRIRLIPPADRQENIGYPTQKPEELVSRIVNASSNPGDLVLDAFAGSGTTLAVAEKLGRRWIGIDCGKFAIYTIQKRMLNLKSEIGNKGKPLAPKPFTLYNAGLYDFSTLRQLARDDWRFFALNLFGCKDAPHTIGGLKLDGKLRGYSVLVFNHHEHPNQRIDEETVQDIHTHVGKKVGGKFFIIAPRAVFDFQQDYIDLDDVRYYALRIPYSVINELHSRSFAALRQPVDETDVNDIVDAWGFDFIQPPTVDWNVSIKKRKGQLLKEACLKIKKFESRARIRGQEKLGGFDTFAMLMLDYDFDGKVFALDAVFYAHQLENTDWQAWFPIEDIGDQVMAVFLDLYGNEARQIITREQLGLDAKPNGNKRKKANKK